jgi:hypothetical protein
MICALISNTGRPAPRGSASSRPSSPASEPDVDEREIGSARLGDLQRRGAAILQVTDVVSSILQFVSQDHRDQRFVFEGHQRLARLAGLRWRVSPPSG